MTETMEHSLGVRSRRFRPYPEYKDSGVEWLGKIPAHWEALRLKFLVSKPLQYGANEAAELIDPTLPRYIRITDVRDDGSLRNDTYRSLPEDIASPYLLYEGDLLLARSGATVGKTFRYDRSWGTAAYAGYLIRARLVEGQIDSRFAFYYTQSSPYWDWLRSTLIQATIQNVSAERYANLLLPVPPRSEQAELVNHLQRETGRIDALVAKKKRLIELLQEKRTALITGAATKGLDPHVPMKKSGVEWLREIPAHWEVMQLGQTMQLIMDFRGRTPAKLGMEWGGDIPAVSAVNVRDGHIDLSRGVNYGSQELHDRWMTQGPTRAGDIVFTTEAPLGNVAMLPDNERYILSQRVVLLRPRTDRVNAEYLLQFLRASAFRQGVEGRATGSTAEGVKRRYLMAMPVCVPPIEEQAALNAYLSTEMVRIERIVPATEKAISLLQEYRTALISAAVTGKIDVREDRM
jgi:type I restriction enzyme S subunit